MAGKVLGRHEGIVGYTVGQRKGLPGGFAEPMYVVEIRTATNEVVIGPKEALGRRVFTVKEMNCLGAAATGGLKVKIRAQHAAMDCMVEDLGDDRVEVVLAEPDAVSPGQAAVFTPLTALCWVVAGLK